jgi:hypothetical protein
MHIAIDEKFLDNIFVGSSKIYLTVLKLLNLFTENYL